MIRLYTKAEIEQKYGSGWACKGPGFNSDMLKFLGTCFLESDFPAEFIQLLRDFASGAIDDKEKTLSFTLKGTKSNSYWAIWMFDISRMIISVPETPSIHLVIGDWVHSPACTSPGKILSIDVITKDAIVAFPYSSTKRVKLALLVKAPSPYNFYQKHVRFGDECSLIFVSDTIFEKHYGKPVKCVSQDYDSSIRDDRETKIFKNIETGESFVYSTKYIIVSKRVTPITMTGMESPLSSVLSTKQDSNQKDWKGLTSSDHLGKTASTKKCDYEHGATCRASEHNCDACFFHKNPEPDDEEMEPGGLIPEPEDHPCDEDECVDPDCRGCKDYKKPVDPNHMDVRTDKEVSVSELPIEYSVSVKVDPEIYV